MAGLTVKKSLIKKYENVIFLSFSLHGSLKFQFDYSVYILIVANTH